MPSIRNSQDDYRASTDTAASNDAEEDGYTADEGVVILDFSDSDVMKLRRDMQTAVDGFVGSGDLLIVIESCFNPEKVDEALEPLHLKGRRFTDKGKGVVMSAS